MSELKAMLKRHREEIDQLRKSCDHNRIKIKKDHSVVGCGSLYPSIHVICQNCGAMKIMFLNSAKERNEQIIKTLSRQPGIEDQRLDCVVQHEYELD